MIATQDREEEEANLLVYLLYVNQKTLADMLPN